MTDRWMAGRRRWLGVMPAGVSVAVGVASMWWLTAPVGRVCTWHRVTPHHRRLDCAITFTHVLPLPLAVAVLLLALSGATVLLLPVVRSGTRVPQWSQRVAGAGLVGVALVPLAHAAALASGARVTRDVGWTYTTFYVLGGFAVALAVLMGIPVLLEGVDPVARRGWTGRASVTGLAALGTAVTAGLIEAGAPLATLPFPLLLVGAALAVLVHESWWDSRARILLLSVLVACVTIAGVMLLGVLGALAFADTVGPVVFFGWSAALATVCATGLLAEPSGAPSGVVTSSAPGTSATSGDPRAARWLVGVLVATAVVAPLTVVILSAALCGLGSCYGSAGAQPGVWAATVVLGGAVLAGVLAGAAPPGAQKRAGGVLLTVALPYALLFFGIASGAMGGGSGDYFAITVEAFGLALLVLLIVVALGAVLHHAGRARQRDAAVVDAAGPPANHDRVVG